jgi:hypothetical protein
MNHGRFKQYRSNKAAPSLGKALKKAAKPFQPKQAGKPKPKPTDPNQGNLFDKPGIYRGTFPIEI